MKKKLLLAAAALLLMTQCTKPAVELPTPEPTPTPTGLVHMTVTAGSGRTTINDEGGIAWSENDKLYVAASVHGSKAYAWKGYLTVVKSSETGEVINTFQGTLSGLTDGTTYDFHFFYLGTGADTKPTPEDNNAEVTFSPQAITVSGTEHELTGASAFHVGYGDEVENVTVSGTEVTITGTVHIRSKVAIAYFKFVKEDGTNYTGEVTVSGDKIYNKMAIGPDGTFTGSVQSSKGNITLSDGTAERYVMLIPSNYGGTKEEVTVNFTGDGKTGSFTFPEGIEESCLYRLGDGPLVVTLK